MSLDNVAIKNLNEKKIIGYEYGVYLASDGTTDIYEEGSQRKQFKSTVVWTSDMAPQHLAGSDSLIGWSQYCHWWLERGLVG